MTCSVAFVHAESGIFLNKVRKMNTSENTELVLDLSKTASPTYFQ